MPGPIRQAEATITSATDTTLVAAPEAGQHLEIEEIHVANFTYDANATLRFENSAGGTVMGGLGAVGPLGSTNPPGVRIQKIFSIPYKGVENKGISIETVGIATWYIYVKYRIVDTAQ